MNTSNSLILLFFKFKYSKFCKDPKVKINSTLEFSQVKLINEKAANSNDSSGN